MSDRVRTGLLVAASFLFVLGAVGWIVRSNAGEPRLVIEAARWRIVDRDGHPVAPDFAGSLRLSPGQKVAVSAPAGDEMTIESVVAEYHLWTGASSVESVFSDPLGGLVRVRAAGEQHGGVVLAERRPPRHERVLKTRPRPRSEGERFRREELLVRRDSQDVIVRVDGAELSAARTTVDRWSEMTFGPRGGDIGLIRLTFAGHANGSPFSETIDRDALTGGGLDASRSGRGAILVLVAVLYVVGLLGALCRSRPRAAIWAGAVGVIFALPALYSAYGLVSRASGSPLWIAILALPGWLPALFLLRNYVRPRSESAGPQGARDGVTVLVVVLAFASLLFVQLGAVRFEEALQVESRKLEVRAISARGRAPEASAPAVALGPHNACSLPGSYQSFDLRLRASLTSESVLQVRVRAGEAASPLGTSLFLAAGSDWGSSFQNETRLGLVPLATLPDAAPDTPFDLLMEVRGRKIRLLIDGDEVAQASSRLFPSGSIIALAAAGQVDLQAISVVPTASPPLPTAAADSVWIRIVSTLLFVMAVVGLWLTVRVPFLRAAVMVAIGVLPIGVFFFTASPTNGAGLVEVVVPISLAILYLSLVTGVHGRPGTRLRRTGFLIMLLVMGATLFPYLDQRSWPASKAQIAQLTPMDYHGAPLIRGFEHLQHAKLRRWNTYLAAHQLRGRSHRLEKEEGAIRILVLGTSSTYGYKTDDPWGFKLERGLNDVGENVEVMIGAVQGGCLTQQRILLENALLSFRPDMIVGCFFYNDAVELAQVDLDAFFDNANHASTFQRWISDAATRVSMRAEMRRFHAWSGGDEPTDQERRSKDIPPARFERGLTRLAELARDEQIELVLIQEPTVLKNARSRPRPWEGEMRASMNAVGDRYKLDVIDPEPVLSRRGGAELFLDAVHPTDAGHKAMADAVFPSIRRALRRLRVR